MTGNHYINQDVQKAFLDGVPGCVEHQFKLWSAQTDAQRNQRNIHLCLLDIANAYGSVCRNLIVQALHHYHFAFGRKSKVTPPQYVPQAVAALFAAFLCFQQ